MSIAEESGSTRETCDRIGFDADGLLGVAAGSSADHRAARFGGCTAAVELHPAQVRIVGAPSNQSHFSIAFNRNEVVIPGEDHGGRQCEFLG